jgi:hypothetical protein
MSRPGIEPRASAVEGEHSRQEPFEQLFSIVFFVPCSNNKLFYSTFFEAFLYNSRKYCPGIKETDLLMLQLGTFIYTPYCNVADSYSFDTDPDPAF